MQIWSFVCLWYVFYSFKVMIWVSFLLNRVDIKLWLVIGNGQSDLAAMLSAPVVGLPAVTSSTKK